MDDLDVASSLIASEEALVSSSVVGLAIGEEAREVESKEEVEFPPRSEAFSCKTPDSVGATAHSNSRLRDSDPFKSPDPPDLSDPSDSIEKEEQITELLKQYLEPEGTIQNGRMQELLKGRDAVLPDPRRGRGRPKGWVLQDWMMQMVEYLILSPGITNKKLAEHLMVTPEYVSKIKNSKPFKDYWAERFRDHQEKVSNAVIAKAGKVALQGLEVMSAKMKSNPDSLSLGEVTKATEMTGKMLGLGQTAGAGVQNLVVVETGGVDKELLARARETMHKVGEMHSKDNMKVIEGSVNERNKEYEGTASREAVGG